MKDPARTRSLVTRDDGTRQKKTTVYLEERLAKRLAHFAIDTDRNMSEIMQAALEEYLSKHG